MSSKYQTCPRYKEDRSFMFDAYRKGYVLMCPEEAFGRGFSCVNRHKGMRIIILGTERTDFPIHLPESLEDCQTVPVRIWAMDDFRSPLIRVAACPVTHGILGLNISTIAAQLMKHNQGPFRVDVDDEVSFVLMSQSDFDALE